MDRETFKDERVIQLSEQFVPVKIDADQDHKTARKYHVRSYPTIIIADERGRPLARISGYMEATPFSEKMDTIARVHRELPEMEARFEADPGDLANAGTLAAAHAARGKIGKAKRTIKAIEEADPQNKQGYLTEAYMSLGDCYLEREKYRDASKYFLKAADTSAEATVVADARYATAWAYFEAREMVRSGTSTYQHYLDQAEEQLELVAKMPELPGDRQENVDRLKKSIAEARKG